MIAARAREMYDRQAKERQVVRKGHQAGATPEVLPELEEGDSRDHAEKAAFPQAHPPPGDRSPKT